MKFVHRNRFRCLALAVTLPMLANAAPAEERTASRVTVRGIELHFAERGAGEPVILLHGGQGDYRAWPALMDALAPHYRVLSYSRRYHWPNGNPITGRSHSALVDADDLAALMTKLRLRSAHLVGTSYGAFTALALAVRHPERVRSLVLAEPPIHTWVNHTGRGAALYRERVAAVHEPARKAFARGDDEAAMRLFIDLFDGPGTFDRLPGERRTTILQNARFFKALTASSNPFPKLSREAVRRLKVPVLLVSGEHTDELHRMIVDELARVLPAAQRVTIPGAGHGSPRQNPRAFNDATLEFLARGPGASATAGSRPPIRPSRRDR